MLSPHNINLYELSEHTKDAGFFSSSKCIIQLSDTTSETTYTSGMQEAKLARVVEERFPVETAGLRDRLQSVNSIQFTLPWGRSKSQMHREKVLLLAQQPVNPTPSHGAAPAISAMTLTVSSCRRANLISISDSPRPS